MGGGGGGGEASVKSRGQVSTNSALGLCFWLVSVGRADWALGGIF